MMNPALVEFQERKARHDARVARMVEKVAYPEHVLCAVTLDEPGSVSTRWTMAGLDPAGDGIMFAGSHTGDDGGAELVGSYRAVSRRVQLLKLRPRAVIATVFSRDLDPLSSTWTMRGRIGREAPTALHERFSRPDLQQIADFVAEGWLRWIAVGGRMDLGVLPYDTRSFFEMLEAAQVELI